MEDYTAKYIGEEVDVWMFNGESQPGILTAFCIVGEMPYVELNGHILLPMQNVSGIHCASRCDNEHPGWPPANLDDLDD